METKTALMIIDPQNDFCNPEGSLFVPGAEADMQRLAGFIKRNSEHIDKILFTLDSHQVYDISHPGFWTDADGNRPEPFTAITLTDLESGRWKAVKDNDKALDYLQQLEQKSEYTHMIWPEHCISGSWGASLALPIENAVREWAQAGKTFMPVYKGTNPYTEHFGALRANVPDAYDAGSLLNRKLIAELEKYTTIYIAGEAQSHCVANTLKQLMESTDLISRCVFILDCMTDVVGFEGYADSVFDEARNKGAELCDSGFVIVAD